MSKTKVMKYQIERFLLQNDVINILGLSNGFYLCDVDADAEIQQKILNLIPDIKKYFYQVNICGLIYPEKCKRAWLSIVRGVLKDRYTLCYKACRYPKNNMLTMQYYIKDILNTTLLSNKNIPIINTNLKKNTFSKKQLKLTFRSSTSSISTSNSNSYIKEQVFSS
jgi:hypothetical protein